MTPTPDPAAVAASLTPVQRNVLLALDCHYGKGPSHMVVDLDISMGEARATLQWLNREGLCDYGPLHDEDSGALMGRGYWIEAWGRRVRDELEAVND
ncbi:hypothetical protein [Sphingobium lignivorans]|uniref:MarR family transcriptional regulator n=1 Tax=Sphingobium lignivorans TaxID=2735886 RepID=A0ABR6NFD1_9SPHN|nr:hypothetical protein [Sphingobium lignivorans]MBB5985976.1 hypothetical protein [Sphingobium lignivorans]